MSEKKVKESEDFEGRDSGWTLDEILRLEVCTNRYSPFRGSSSFIEVPKQIAETKEIINVINKKDSQCFMWSILAALCSNTSNPNKTSSYVPHLNKLNFDGISLPTPLNEVKKFSKMNDIGINIYSFEEDLKIFPLLISDIVYLFENFRKICMKTYKLDPCWYFTTPALSWDAMLLHTKVVIELFTDCDMLLFIEKGVRGGISQCCNRYAIANNRYMSNFNTDEEIKYLMYLDANNLYGYAMSKYLPLKDFVWSDNDLTEQDIFNLSDESDVGYILEVDLEYPSDLHDKHSDFPLAPENKHPPNCLREAGWSNRRIGRHLSRSDMVVARCWQSGSQKAVSTGFCRPRATWSVTDWRRVIFSDESRFSLSADDHRTRVWRRTGQRSDPAFIVERHTAISQGVTVWGAISWDTRSSLVILQGTLTARRYVDDILTPIVLPMLSSKRCHLSTG
ncbi:uncharacterized protein TNCV_3137121 [Trichonephila clavipes]|nr:uncharacterized protein TNCV_3137121 [Trichonephila clavipes]